MTSDILTISVIKHTDTTLPLTQDPQLVFVLRDSLQIYQSGAGYPLGLHDIFLLNPFQNCLCTFPSSQSLAVVLRFSHAYLAEQTGTPFLLFHTLLVRRGDAFHQDLQLLVQQLLTLYTSASPLDHIRFQAGLYNLLFLLINSFMIANPDSRPELSKNKAARLSAILAYIHQNYRRPITLKTLSDQFYLSVPYLSRFLKKNLGTNFLEYLTRLRTSRAMEDLRSTDVPISQIAFDHGFASLATFNRCVRGACGQSPSAYRKSHAACAAPADNDQELLKQFLHSHPFQAAQGAAAAPLVCSVDASAARPYKQNWKNTLNLGTASELADSRVQSQILLLKKDLGFVYGHVWRLFGKEMLINASSQSFNFSRLDIVLDFLLDAQITPFLDVGFRAKRLSLVAATSYSASLTTEYNRDLQDSRINTPEQYHNLLSSFMRHCIFRYGIERVATWRFGLYISTDAPLASDGGISWQSIFHTAHRCLKSYIPSVELGISGVTTFDDNQTFTEVISHIARWQLQPDFVGINIYPYSIAQEKSLDTASSLNEFFLSHKLDSLYELLHQYNLSHMVLYVIEWNFSFLSRNFLHDSVYKGAYIVKNVIDCLGRTDVLSYWGSIDLLHEYFDSKQVLCGAPGLLCKNGIPKPSFHALAFLGRAKSFLVAQSSHFLFTSDKNNNYAIICHNFCPPGMDYYYQYGESIPSEKVDGLFHTSPITLSFQIENTRSGRYRVKKRFINQSTGNLLSEWIRLGKPFSLSRDEQEFLFASSVPYQTNEIVDADDSTLSFTSMLQVNEIQLLEVQYLFD